MGYNALAGLFVIEVINSNPNGDPDRDGEPRRNHKGNGLITPVSIKRKYRDLIESKENNDIWKEFGQALDPDNCAILESIYSKNTSIKKELKTNPNYITDNFWDARLFGNTYLEKKDADGKDGKEPITHIGSGPLSIGLGVSVNKIEIERLTLSRKSNPEEGKKGGLAPNAYKIVPYGIYTIPFAYSPYQAKRMKCTDDDLELFFNLTPYIYEYTKSLIRSQVNILAVHVGEHRGGEYAIKTSFNVQNFIASLTPKLNEGAEGIDRNDFEIPTWDDVKDNFGGVKRYFNLIEF